MGITRIAAQNTGLFQIPKPLARAEADRLAERYGDRNAVPWITANSGFARAYFKNSESSKLDTLTPSQRPFDSFKNRFDGLLCCGLRQPGLIDDMIDNI